MRNPILAIALLLIGTAVAAQVPYPSLGDIDPGAKQKIDEAHAAVEAAPQDATAWGAYGMMLDAHSLADDAVVAYREAMRLDSSDFRWPYFLGILLEPDDPEASIEHFDKATALRPDYAPVRVRHAQALETVGRDADAGVQYRAGAQIDPNAPMAPLGLGRLALAADRIDEAIGHLERAYNLDSRVQAVVTTLSRAYARAGREEEARGKAEEAINLPRVLPLDDPVRVAVMDQARLTGLELIYVEHPALDEMETTVREQIAAARDRLDNVVAQGPGVSAQALGQAFGNLGELYLIYDLSDPARSCLSNAASLLRSELRWPHLLGTSYEHDRELEDAKKWYGLAATLDDSYVPALIRFGKVSLLLGELPEASRALERARELDPDSAAAYAWLGRAALRRGETQEGVDLLEKALELQPGATALHYETSQAYRRLGNDPAADDHLAKRGETTVNFRDPVAEEVRGRIRGLGAAATLSQVALRDGNYNAAEAHARAAVVSEPTNASSHRLLAGVLATGGKFGEARREFERAIELEPQDVGLRLSFVTLLSAIGDDRAIIAVLEEALAHAPDHGRLYGELGAALLRQGNLEDAELRLADAARLDPDNAGVARLHAHALERLDRDDEALAELERLVELEPESADARVSLARKLGERGQQEQAQGHLEAAVASDPDRVEAHRQLALLHGQAQRFAESATHQAVVVRLRPEEPGNHLLLATARIFAGDFAQARQDLIKALATHQNDPRLADTLARLLAAAPDDTQRDGVSAVQLAATIFRDTPAPDFGETLAMAWAEVGNFDEAVALQERVLAQRRAAGQETEVARAQAWLASYRRGEAVRSPWLE